MMTRSRIRQTAVLLTTTVLLVSTVATVAPPAAAAGQTSVRLVPGTDQLGVQETTTVEVVATNADGGVGAYNATVSLDSEYASITNASASNAQLKRIEIADDGSSANLAVALLDTPDEGSVTIATLTIAGSAAGTSSLSVQVNALADEEGRTYEVAGTSGTTVTVTEQSTPVNTKRTTTPVAGTPSSDAGGGDVSGSTDASGQTDGQAENGAQSTLVGSLGIDSPVVMALVGLVVLGAVLAIGLFIGRRY